MKKYYKLLSLSVACLCSMSAQAAEEQFNDALRAANAGNTELLQQYRLSMQNDGQGAILDGEQIVLIDELDLHLHPSWQLQLVSNLERKFPNCQFFVSSHSSLVLSSIGEEDKLVVLRDGEQVELSDIPYGDNGDYILKRFFGLRSVRNPKVQEEIDSISAELVKDHPDINDVERKLNALSEKGVQFEESVKMRLQLAQIKES